MINYIDVNHVNAYYTINICTHQKLKDYEKYDSIHIWLIFHIIGHNNFSWYTEIRVLTNKHCKILCSIN